MPRTSGAFFIMAVFALFTTSSCLAGQSFSSMLAFAETAVADKHQIDHIFLYEDATLAAASAIDLPSDEPDLSLLLAQFCQQHSIPLLFCVTAAEKRGVFSPHQPARSGYTAAGLAEFAIRLNRPALKLVQF